MRASRRFGRKGVAINVSIAGASRVRVKLTAALVQFVTNDDVKILRDLEQYYATQIVSLNNPLCRRRTELTRLPCAGRDAKFSRSTFT